MMKYCTDGFRGIIADTCTKENIQKIGAAFRKIAESQKKQINIVIGFDNRFMGREFAAWFCEAACSDIIRATFMTVPVSTPFIAYKAVTQDFGIMITASHNPYMYSGIKTFLNGGKAADDDFGARLLNEISEMKNIKLTDFNLLVKDGYITFSDSIDDYVDKVVSLTDTKTIKATAPKVLINPMHGSSTEAIRQLFGKLGIKYNAIKDELDPYFGGGVVAPYPHVLTKMAEEVVKGKYNFGIALDGDGDRAAVIDHDGKIYDCNYLSAALMYHLLENRKQKGGAVKVFLASNLIVKVCEHFGFKVKEVRVGYKFVAPKMQETAALIGAESGGMGFSSVSLHKDGIATAALLVDMIAAMKKNIGEILKEIVKLVSFPSASLEFPYPFNPADGKNLLEKILGPEKPKFLQPAIDIENFPDGYKLRFKDGYWCGVRISGNEPVLRFYTEMHDLAACQEVIEILEKFYGFTERQK